MAGGIGLPFQLNPKCVIFSGLLMLAYYALPMQDTNVYDFYIPIITTIAILLYYYLYACQNNSTLILILIITLVTMLFQYLYWYLPRNLWSIYYAIFFIGYIALAYFDYVMQCSIPLQAGMVSMTHLFKLK
jgi:hypothetical protein